MSALTSLLVRDQRVPVQKIEEAIQRQVISGGSLDTVLLELDAVPENVLAAYCAAAVDKTAATRAELEAVSRDVVRVVPKEVAERHRLVPLGHLGEALLVAVAQPLDAETVQQLGFLLGAPLEQRVAPAARVALALRQHYGIEPVPRIRRLGRRLAERDPGEAPEVAPLAANVATRPNESEGYGHSDAPGEGPNTQRFGTLSEPRRVPIVTETVIARDVTARQPGPPIPITRSVSVGEPAAAPLPASDPPASGGASRRRIAEPQTERLRRLRGPLTARRAVDMLGPTEDRDEILEIGFAFIRQFFDYTAAFVVHDGRVEGLDGAGIGAADFDAVQRITVELDEPSSFAIAHEGAVPLITHLDGSDADRRVRAVLRRDAQLPAVLLPVAIRGRVVLIFYGDRSGDAFGLADVPEPLAYLPRLADAFQRLILRRKLQGYEKARRTSGPPPEPSQEDAASAPAAWSGAAENDSFPPTEELAGRVAPSSFAPEPRSSRPVDRWSSAPPPPHVTPSQPPPPSPEPSRRFA
ncbi:MAG: hypothetical protein AAGH15_21790, partial [Myxococcota bacterium]